MQLAYAIATNSSINLESICIKRALDGRNSNTMQQHKALASRGSQYNYFMIINIKKMCKIETHLG